MAAVLSASVRSQGALTVVASPPHLVTMASITPLLAQVQTSVQSPSAEFWVQAVTNWPKSWSRLIVPDVAAVGAGVGFWAFESESAVTVGLSAAGPSLCLCFLPPHAVNAREAAIMMEARFFVFIKYSLKFIDVGYPRTGIYRK